MWLFELLGLTMIAGTFLGLGWRFTEDFLEKRNARKALAEFGDNEQPTDSTPVLVVTAITPVDVPTASTSVSKSN